MHTDSSFPSRIRDVVWLLTALVLASAMWFYVQHVLIAYQRADAARRGSPRGNLSDLYPRWLGSRELLLHQRDPYSAEVTAEIEEGYYGRRLDPSRPSDPKDPQAFAYPPYVALLLAPFVNLPFATVQRLFAWVLLLATIGSVFCWLRFLDWRPRWPTLLTILILTICSFQWIQGFKLQQLTLVVVSLMAASAALLRRGWLLCAGAVLALATIKPQLVAPLVLFLCVWIFTAWRERQRLFWGFTVVLLCLVAFAQWLLPGWIPEFWHAMAEYRRYTGGLSLLDVMVGPMAGKLLTVVVLAAVGWTSWHFRREAGDSRSFALAFCFVLAATFLVIPMFALYNQLLLLPTVLTFVRDWDRVRRERGLARTAGLAASCFLAWQWLAALVLMLLAPFIPAASLQRAWTVPLWSMLAIPVTWLLVLVPWLRTAEVTHPAASGPMLALQERPR